MYNVRGKLLTHGTIKKPKNVSRYYDDVIDVVFLWKRKGKTACRIIFIIIYEGVRLRLGGI